MKKKGKMRRKEAYKGKDAKTKKDVQNLAPDTLKIGFGVTNTKCQVWKNFNIFIKFYNWFRSIFFTTIASTHNNINIHFTLCWRNLSTSTENPISSLKILQVIPYKF